jgi:hypothetical protein
LVPILCLLLFGIIEYGLFFRDYLTISNTTRAGARAGSAAGNDASADFTILQHVTAAASALPGGSDSIDGVIVFDSGSADGAVPAGCSLATGSVDGVCNVYLPADLVRPRTDFGCAPASPDRFWCPADRVISLSAGTDYLGVHVIVTHHNVTGLFSTSPTRLMKDTVVMRVEPQQS